MIICDVFPVVAFGVKDFGVVKDRGVGAVRVRDPARTPSMCAAGSAAAISALTARIFLIITWLPP
jgi:hypothetical protein